jgi:outer membrane protein assembly factor BamB
MQLGDMRFRVVAAGFVLPTAALALLLTSAARPAHAFIDNPPESLRTVCQMADAIAVLRVETVNREKKGIVYRKVRDLKKSFPTPNRYFGETFTHVLRASPTPDWHPQDNANQDLQNGAILAWAAEGKTAVIFQRGGEQAICIGHYWYTTRGNPPPKDRWVLAAGCDSRYTRFYCGDVDGLIAAITDLLAGKEATVPHTVGTPKLLSDGTAPIRRIRADRAEPQREFYSPFLGHAPWSTHRGNPQRTGADDGPGPKGATVLWVHKSEDHFIAPLVPGAKDLFASSLGAFNSPGFHALALEPAGDKQVRWEKGAPLLRQPIAGAPALLGGHTEMLVFGDGFHTDEGGSLRCVRAADGFPLWHLPVPGKLVHVQGTPTVANARLYVGAGNAGVFCVEPGRVTFEGREQDLVAVQAMLEQRWKEMLAKYEVEKQKDQQFALPPDESMLPRPTPKRLWQQGKDKWHVDAPIAVVEEYVLAASAYLDDEKTGERALICLKAGDGAFLWKTPLRLNPWAGPTVGPYVLVGCSSIRLDPKAIAGARGEVVAIELDTGAIKWRKEVPGGVLSSIAVRAGLALFTATDGKVRAWDAHTGQERWTYDAKAPFFAGPAVTGMTVYAADLHGVVHAVKLADGTGQWTLDLGADPATKAPGMVYGSPIVHRGRLYLATCNLGARAARTPNVVVCIGDK